MPRWFGMSRLHSSLCAADSSRIAARLISRLVVRSHRGFLLLLFAAALASCRNPDVFSSSYGTMQEAVDSGIVRQGWVPAWLPDHATQIREIHDLDSNEWAVPFKYAPQHSLAVPTGCTATKGLETFRPRIGPDWWPEDVPSGVLGTPRHQYFQCWGYFLAKSDSRGEAFVWSHPLDGLAPGTLP